MLNDNLYTQVELFSGCGGMALGLTRAGFRTLAFVEKDMSAGDTFERNFTSINRNKIARFGDITTISDPTTLLAGQTINQLDLLAGGPPCQAYSRAGRGKLASIKGEKSAHLDDSRGQLYKNYLMFVKELKPKAVLMENVPEIMNHGGDNLAEIICQDLDSMGYEARYTVLNCASYGVPQYRERWFMLAFRNDLRIIPKFPCPTHNASDFNITAFSPIILLQKAIQAGSRHAVIPPLTENNLPNAISVGEALSDLPFTTYFENGRSNSKKNYCENLNDSLPYNSVPTNSFQNEVRNWPGIVCSPKVTANLFRLTERDFPIFARMNPSDRYIDALNIAYNILAEEIDKRGLANVASEDSRIVNLKASIVPPYPEDKFLDKWRMLNPSSPSHTVVAHLAVDTYSHIHYDKTQARGVTVRESARLQSFPDGFVFTRNMGESFRQIGNAVPPIVAYKLGVQIRKLLENKC